ncbi:hypothetical protein [Desulforhopalus sp. IMCC35007]|uniref:hypothetical protein n=1 Tax=Desulforhopalus sp. IMCC35007 TaxID=2569543 RepID=UPI0010ADCC47|nr:hypothetical protein [Desulforhopalus sp. IMCC35007]TKB11365.1 hypothetical protein FCL48_04990 [Desulforhopalus sp. IMCC35007]
MNKTRATHLLLFTAIIAFITVQWSATHIHLASPHSHEQDNHQHPVEVHSHRSIDTSSIAEDVAQQRHSSIAIEFGQEYRFSKNGKPKKPFLAVIGTGFKLQNSPLITCTTRTFLNASLRDFNRSTINPRAPPYIS